MKKGSAFLAIFVSSIAVLLLVSAASAEMTNAQHLKEYKKFLRLGDPINAVPHMKVLPKDSAEYKEAVRYSAELKKEREAAAAARKKAADKDAIVSRKLFAKKYEDSLLDQGMDAHVSTLGRDHSTLQIKFIGVGRVLVHQISKNGELMESFRKMGFKKLKMTNGYEENWSITL